ncbi:MAG: hypothetical protein GF393_00355 [Armatimonadia bacterium]|nr:hypothetical protein [Armatimonadia bacterium]
MAAPETAQDNQNAPDQRLKDLPKWADRYARNRTIPALLMMTVFFIGFAVFSLLGTGVARAFDSGYPALGIAAVVVLLAAVAGWLWAVFSGVLSRWGSNVAKRYYEREGMATAKAGERPKWSWRSWIIFAALITAPVAMGLLPIDPQYSQALAACYLVPLMVWWATTDGKITLPMGLLWPVLYALHAVAMVLGAPLVIGGDAGPTVMWPALGYLFVALLAGHIYSRYALKRMREISREAADEEGQ